MKTQKNTYGLTVETGSGLEQVEIFFIAEHEATARDEDTGELLYGWFYGFCQPDCVYPDGPDGPFDSKKQAYDAARYNCEELPCWRTLRRRGIVR